MFRVSGGWGSLQQRARALALAVLLIVPMLARPARADRPGGVTAQSIVLPNGPAALKGLGESFEPNMATGTGSYSVPLSAPPGFLAPSLSLSYAGGRGKGDLGQGWSLPVLQVYRQTDKGAPHFNEKDRFAVTGGGLNDELVLVNEKLRYYRLKNEGAFALFIRSPDRDSWTIRMPGGETSFLGESSESRESARGRTCRWFLNKQSDRFGHWTEYHYFTDRGHVYLDEITYQLHADPAFQNSVSFTYEDRPDVFTSYSYGGASTTAKRLSTIAMFHGARLLRSYRLGYRSSLLFSLLTSVELTGEDGLKMPPLSFDYLDDSADGGELVKVSTAAPLDALIEGWGELDDVNADGLPDLLVSRAGDYRYYENLDGRSLGSARSLRNSPDHDLTEDGVVFADIDGDGFRDLVHPQGDHFRYYPGGDIDDGVFRGYGAAVELRTQSDGFVFTSPDLKLGDQNHDGRIDLLWQKPGHDSWLVNGADDVLREEATRELPVDIDFEDPRVQLTDFNGDSLLDFVQKNIGLDSSTLSVWFGLGHGEFAPAVRVPGVPKGDPSEFHLLDVNRDGQADLLRISGTWATIYVNRGSLGFSGARGDFHGLPAASATLKLLFADMNGNGTTDVVWVTDDFNLRYLELSGEPNAGLLSRIDNGMGLITELAYRSSTELAVEDKKAGKPWAHPMASPVPVVSEIRTTDSLDVLGLAATETRTTFDYRDGLYDGREHEFRGFETATVTEWGDALHATLVTETHMHVGRNAATGADEEILKGRPYLQLRRGTDGKLFSAVETRWQQKLLCQEGLPSGSESILPRCAPLGLVGTLGQGAPREKKDQLVTLGLEVATLTATYEQTQAPRFTATKSEFDAWGRLTTETKYGEVEYSGHYSPGSGIDEGKLDGGYAGDEQVNKTSFLYDTNQWLIGLPYQSELRDLSGQLYERARTYYDDLALGKASHGLVTRLTRYDADLARYIDVEQNAYDAHGNKIASVNAVGDRVELGYEPNSSLLPNRESIQIGASDYVTFSADYDLGYGAVVSGTDQNGRTSRFVLDGLGRLTRIYDPVHSLPSARFEYTYGSPAFPLSITKLEKLQDDGVSGGQYLTTYSYSDASGTPRQEKTKAEAALGWIASSYTRFSARGKPVIVYDSFTSQSSSFEAPAANVTRTVSHLDALGRAVQVDLPPTERLSAGGRVISQYLPFETRAYDEHESTTGALGNPEITRTDGLGRTVEVEKYNDGPDGPQRLKFRIGYDTRGSIVSFGDPRWNGRADDTRHLRKYTYDSLGRLTKVQDPNAGTTRYAFDEVGRIIERTDALDQVQAWVYGKAGRLLTHRVSNDALGAPAYEYRYHYDAPAPSSPLSADASATPNLLGKLSWLEYPTGEEHYSYDALGRLSEEATRLWNPATSSVEQQQRDTFTGKFKYRADGQIVEATAPGGLELSEAYNTRGFLASLTAKIGGVTRTIADQLAYDHRGAQIGARGGNGIRACARYDNRAQLTHFMASAPGEDCSDASLARADRGYHHLEYVRGHDGLIDSINDLSRLNTGLPRLDAAYGYDAIHQLVGATDARGTTTYQYDEIQNLVRRDVQNDIPEGPVGAFSYGEGTAGPSAITRAGDETFTYDAAGQMQRYNGYDLHFDAEGRLVRATNADKGITLVQHYDDAGERKIALVYRAGQPVKVHRFVSPSYQQRDGEEIWFTGAGSIDAEIVKSRGILVDGYLLDQLTSYVNGAGSTPKPLPEEYMDLNGDGARLDASDLSLAQQGFLSGQRVGGAKTIFRYATSDHLGGATHLTDSAGELVSYQRFRTYGKLGSRVGTKSYKTFIGKDSEPEEDLGLQRIGARYYAPELGRWVTPDPFIGQSPGRMASLLLQSNLYSYASNNPVMRVDPLGLADKAPPAVAVVLSGGADQHLKSMDKLSVKNYGSPGAKAAKLAGNEARRTVAASGADGVSIINDIAKAAKALAADPSPDKRIAVIVHGNSTGFGRKEKGNWVTASKLTAVNNYRYDLAKMEKDLAKVKDRIAKDPVGFSPDEITDREDAIAKYKADNADTGRLSEALKNAATELRNAGVKTVELQGCNVANDPLFKNRFAQILSTDGNSVQASAFTRDVVTLEQNGVTYAGVADKDAKDGMAQKSSERLPVPDSK